MKIFCRPIASEINIRKWRWIGHTLSKGVKLLFAGWRTTGLRKEVEKGTDQLILGRLTAKQVKDSGKY